MGAFDFALPHIRLNITIDHDDTAPGSSRSSSITEDSSGTGVQVSPEGSQGFSDPLDENEESWVLYPDEIGPSDSASRPRTSNQNRPIVEAPRPEPSRRQSSRRQHFDDREHPIPLPRPRRPHLPASSGSVDSNEEWPAYGRGPPHTHGRTYAHWGHATSPPPNYATSYSSVQGYTPFPPVGQQLVPFTNPPAHYGFPSFHSSGPSAPGYLVQGQHGGPAWGSAIATHGGPPFGSHEMIHPATNSGYFPYAPPGYPPIPQPVVSPAVYHAYPGVYSPPPANTPPPPADSSKDDDAFARIEKLFHDQRAEQEAKEAAAKQAAEEAAAKAAAEKKIAEDIAAAAAAAAAAATEEAEKKAAEKAVEEAEKAKAAADAAAEEAEKKMAEAVAAAAPPPPPPPPEERKKPIRFKDAVGRKFSFPFHLCNTWEVSQTQRNAWSSYLQKY
ncbi:MAG: hypothetical protein Q9167_007144 [Letrouitia subvulpina]